MPICYFHFITMWILLNMDLSITVWLHFLPYAFWVWMLMLVIFTWFTFFWHIISLLHLKSFKMAFYISFTWSNLSYNLSFLFYSVEFFLTPLTSIPFLRQMSLDFFLVMSYHQFCFGHAIMQPTFNIHRFWTCRESPKTFLKTVSIMAKLQTSCHYSLNNVS